MFMYGCPQDLLGVMKLLKNYITESGNNRNFNKTSGKYHRGVFFTQTQDNYSKDKKNINSKGGYHCFHCRKQDHWAEDCPNLEEEQLGHLHTNVGT